MQIEGVGEMTAVFLKLIPQILLYYHNDKSTRGTILDNSKKVKNYFSPLYIKETREVIYGVYLDKKFKVLHCSRLGEGDIRSATFPIRMMIKKALDVGASSVVIAHNHPGGLTTPSNEDLIATDQIKASLGLLGIELIDHVIYSNEDALCLSDMGVL